MQQSHNFEPIKQVLTAGQKNPQFTEALNRHKVLSFWHRAASQFFSSAPEETKAIDFRKGVLTVACLSQQLASQIKLLAERIIYLLNKLLGTVMVFSLRVEY